MLFAPDGVALSAYGWPTTAPVFWEVATGKIRRAKQNGHRFPIDVEAFAHDSANLATGSRDGSIILWSVPDQARRSQLPKQNAGVESLAFSPDGRSLVAGYHDGLVRLWERDSGLELATLEGHTRPVVRACFSADGRTLATCGDVAGTGYEIFLWPSTPEK